MQAPVISNSGHAFFLDFKDVVYIDAETAKRYIYLHTATASFQLVRSIMDLAAATSESLLQRVEQNKIVNFENITAYEILIKAFYISKQQEKTKCHLVMYPEITNQRWLSI